MKRLLIFLVFAVVSVFAQVKDQTEYRLVFSDSISNSQAKVFYIDLTNLESVDSVGFALVTYGAVSVDSVLTYQLGWRGNLPRGNFGTITASAYGSGVNIATATDVTTTGTTASYNVYTTRLSKATVIPYQSIKCTITALSSGNTASATAQRVAVYVILYR